MPAALLTLKSEGSYAMLDAAQSKAASHETSKRPFRRLCSGIAGSPQITEESGSACAAAEPTCGRLAGGARGEPPPPPAFTAGFASAPILIRPRFRLRGGELVTLAEAAECWRGFRVSKVRDSSGSRY